MIPQRRTAVKQSPRKNEAATCRTPPRFAACFRIFLFVADGFERGDLDCLVRGLIAGHQSDQHRKHQRKDDELRLDDRRAHHALTTDERLLDEVPRNASAAERAEREQIDDDGYDEAYDYWDDEMDD